MPGVQEVEQFPTGIVIKFMAIPRLSQSLGQHPAPNPSGGLLTRVSPLSKSVAGPLPPFSIPKSCWPDHQGHGSLKVLFMVKFPARPETESVGPMRHRM